MANKGLSEANSTGAYMRMIAELQDRTNQNAAIAADRANRFTWQSQMASQNFNAKEAAKNRDFQLYMSNTSHQREVEDLKRAGLNPVLSANNGAAVTSGSAASSGSSTGQQAAVDMQAAQLYSQYIMNKINNAQQMKINDINNAMSYKISKMNAATSMYNAALGASATRYAAGANAAAAMYAANAALQNSREQRQWDEDHPQTLVGAGSTIVNKVVDGLLGGKSGKGNTPKDTSDKYNPYGNSSAG